MCLWRTDFKWCKSREEVEKEKMRNRVFEGEEYAGEMELLKLGVIVQVFLFNISNT
jgi:hypothetical protein